MTGIDDETMPFKFYNANPDNKLVIDCTVRAISKVTGKDWEDCYIGLAAQGYDMKDMPNSNAVWGAYMRSLGYVRENIPNTCPDCYSIREFCEDNPRGTFLVCTGNHVVAVVDGYYYDTWDSGDDIPIYYWFKDKSRKEDA